MSDLIAIAYPDKETAESVRQRLFQLTVERSIELEDAVIVDREADGKVKLHQVHRPAAAGAAGGALWGGLIGLLFLAPLLGMAVGAAAGCIDRKHRLKIRLRACPRSQPRAGLMN